VNTEDVRELLDRHGLRLKRDLGQNFLTSAAQADELAQLAGVESEDFVIEVGTGFGVLTRALASRARRVRTIEIDSGVVRTLEAESLLPPNVELLHADALEVPLAEWLSEEKGPARLVANLPYSAATPLLRKLLDLREDLVDWSVMVQKEMGRRLTAKRGSKDYGSFTIIHQLCVDLRELRVLGSDSFFPAPKVESSFLRIWPRQTPLLGPGELAEVEAIVRPAFQQRRKTVLNGLRAAGSVLPGVAGDERRERIAALLTGADIDPGTRPEQIGPTAWLALTRAVKAAGGE